MAEAPVFRVQVDEGPTMRVVDPGERQRFNRWLSTLVGLDNELIVRKRRSQRSLDQNAFWWAVPVKLLAEHCGYSSDQMHYALLGECWGYIDGPHGHQVPRVASSSKLTVEQFTELIEWVLVWGPTEMGVAIPAPNEVDTAA